MGTDTNEMNTAADPRSFALPDRSHPVDGRLDSGVQQLYDEYEQHYADHQGPFDSGVSQPDGYRGQDDGEDELLTYRGQERSLARDGAAKSGKRVLCGPDDPAGVERASRHHAFAKRLMRESGRGTSWSVRA